MQELMMQVAHSETAAGRQEAEEMRRHLRRARKHVEELARELQRLRTPPPPPQRGGLIEEPDPDEDDHWVTQKKFDGLKAELEEAGEAHETLVEALVAEFRHAARVRDLACADNSSERVVQRRRIELLKAEVENAKTDHDHIDTATWQLRRELHHKHADLERKSISNAQQALALADRHDMHSEQCAALVPASSALVPASPALSRSNSAANMRVPGQVRKGSLREKR